MSSRRFLGPLDAAEDEKFREHFVRQDQLRALVSDESHIVYGAKGGGKTALRRALTEIENAAFYATGTIDLDTLSFQRVHVELEKACQATGADVMSLARATWRNVIAPILS
jgi:replication-associated recombination protein RarA